MSNWAIQLSQPITEDQQQQLATAGIARVFLPSQQLVQTVWNGKNNEAFTNAIRQSILANCDVIILPDCQPGAKVPVRVATFDYALFLHNTIAPLLTTQKVLLTNGQTFRHASEMWHLLEHIDHHAFGALLCLDNAKLNHESPHVAIPTLNSRIGAMRLSDASPETIQAIDKARGVGFEGIFIINATKLSLEDAIAIQQKLALHINPPKAKPAVKK